MFVQFFNIVNILRLIEKNIHHESDASWKELVQFWQQVWWLIWDHNSLKIQDVDINYKLGE